MRTVVPAVVMTVVLLVAGVGPAFAATTASDDLAVSVSQDDSVVVTVTENGTAAGNATVTVETVGENETYAGAGEYTTDENGTLTLPTPDRLVNASVTATYNGTTATTTALLTSDGPFGQDVSDFVALLENDTDVPMGQLVAAFVLEHNPSSSVPDHAGPGNETNETGPPEHAGNETGPPEDAGPPDDSDDSEDDDADSDDADSDDTEESEEEDEGDDGSGPPDNGQGNGSQNRQGNG